MSENGRQPDEDHSASAAAPPARFESAGCMATALVIVGALFTVASGMCVGTQVLHEFGRMVGGHGNLEEFVIVTIMAVVTIGIGLGVVWLGIKVMNR